MSKYKTFLCSVQAIMMISYVSGCKDEPLNIPDGGGVDIDQSSITVEFDPSAQGQVVKNIFSDINMWDFKASWTTKANGQASDFFAQHYPFVRNVQFMTATGGNPERDLFVDPTDRTNMKDYKFDVLITALRNVVKQGLKPMIKTGAVPMKFSTSPSIGGFGVNVRPPDDYEVYYDYIKALAQTIVAEFGLDEVKTWSWGVLTEYENADWFAAEGKDPVNSKIAYFKLYDYTLSALEDVIGADNLKIGAHSMTCSQGLWNETDFIEHVANGKNFRTGGRIQIDFLSASYYDLEPGKPDPNNITLTNTINMLRDKARACGLTGLRFGIDEGRILNGPNSKKPLTSRIVAHTYQSSADAAMFLLMNNIDADWFSTWGFTTAGLWDGVTVQSAYLAELCHKMAGNPRSKVSVKGDPKDKTSVVSGMGCYDQVSNKVYAMVYNYNPDIAATIGETPNVVINNVAPIVGADVTVTCWTLDDNNANFWPTWAADMKSQNMQESAFDWSSYSVEVPGNILSQSGKAYWYSLEGQYKQLSMLKSVVSKVTPKDNRIVLKPELMHHAVVFYEISNVKTR